MKGMRRQQSKSLHLTDMDRAKIESDVERFLAAGNQIQEVEMGATGLNYGLTITQQQTAKKAGQRGSAKTTRDRKLWGMK